MLDTARRYLSIVRESYCVEFGSRQADGVDKTFLRLRIPLDPWQHVLLRVLHLGSWEDDVSGNISRARSSDAFPAMPSELFRYAWP